MKIENDTLKCASVCLAAVNVLTARLFGSFMRVFSSVAGTGAVLSVTIASIAAFLIALLICRMSRGGDLFDCAQRHFGGTGRAFLAAVLFLYIALSASSALRDFSNLAAYVAFPNTPMWFVMLPFAAAMLIGGFCGFEALGRLFGFIVPVTLGATVLIFLAAVRGADIDNLFPLPGTSTAAVAKSSISGVLLYSDLVLLLLISPKNGTKKCFDRAICAGCAIAAVLNCAFVAVFSASVGYPTSLEIEIPMLVLMKEAYFGRFVRCADAAYMCIASIGEMLYLAFLVYEMTNMLCRGFGIQNRVAFALPCTLIVFFGSLAFSQTAYGFLILVLTGAGIAAVAVALKNLKRRKGHEKN